MKVREFLTLTSYEAKVLIRTAGDLYGDIETTGILKYINEIHENKTATLRMVDNKVLDSEIKFINQGSEKILLLIDLEKKLNKGE